MRPGERISAKFCPDYQRIDSQWSRYAFNPVAPGRGRLNHARTAVDRFGSFSCANASLLPLPIVLPATFGRIIRLFRQCVERPVRPVRMSVKSPLSRKIWRSQPIAEPPASSRENRAVDTFFGTRTEAILATRGLAPFWRYLGSID